MSGPSSLGKVAQDYCEFHINVEARDPNESATSSSLGSRLMRRVSTGVDLKRIVSLGGRACEDKKKSQLKRVLSNDPKPGSENVTSQGISTHTAEKEIRVNCNAEICIPKKVVQVEAGVEEAQQSPAGANAEGATKYPALLSTSRGLQQTAINKERQDKFSLHLDEDKTRQGPRTLKKISSPIQKFTHVAKPQAENWVFESSPVSARSGEIWKTRKQNQQGRETILTDEQNSEESNTSRFLKKLSSGFGRRKDFD